MSPQEVMILASIVTQLAIPVLIVVGLIVAIRGCTKKPEENQG